MNNDNYEQKSKTDYWVTLDEYKKLMDKPKDTLNPMEVTQTNIYEDYITACKYLEEQYDDVSLLPTSADKPISNYNNCIQEIEQKPNKTMGEQNIIDFEKRRQDKQRKQKETVTKDKSLTKVRKKAGYVDAAILLAVIFNVGFIIAMILLKK